MNIKELKIGDPLEIELVEVKNRSKHMIVSQLIDIKGDLLVINNPLKRGIPYPLREGQQIKIIFYREEKGIFSFLAEIYKKLQGRLTIYTVKALCEPEKIQRRYFFRLDAILKVTLRDLSEDEVIESFTKDISGGGMKLISKKTFPEGSIMECTLFFRDHDKVTFTGEVIRSIKNPETNEFELGIRYKDIGEGVRNQIISFIFERQRLLRKKGLI
ncbi:flagellar brake protein [Alkaliphilus serpentinus]|uniref:C-di-GMP-binding flagellar brake protein YcgR, contains PilZNR and PilZ domains n=1 Tax=Alkaliphilus serpentinus TaxID=1482731 RepID=A0A833HPU6_9FIRM|nr:PilZ domain-containing protein [Alkaliphilus serpentinus]KAB3531364.1 hypothetical protein F8153_04075 [Alkaliphilus serpentinus]